MPSMLKVAVVDDSREIQRSFGALLEALGGLRVVGFAEDRAGALRLVDEERPDVLVLDVELRGNDRGYDVLRDVSERFPQVRVVALSNFGWRAMREAFLRAGACAYFDKAIQFGQALDWIARQRARPVTAVEPMQSPGSAGRAS
jgi:two-component system, OmpR family, response regulator